MKAACLSFALAFTAFAPGIAHSAESTQLVAAAPVADSHVAMVDALISGMDVAALVDGTLAQVKTALIAEPELVALEKSYPGTLTQIVEGLRPLVLGIAQRNLTTAHSELLDFMRANLTPAEAAGAAEFYASPVGKRMIQLVSENFSMKSTLKEAVRTEGDVSNDAVRQDMATTARKSVDALTPAELASLGKLANASWLKKMKVLQPKMVELNTRNFNAPLSEEDQAAMERIIVAIVEKRVAGKN